MKKVISVTGEAIDFLVSGVRHSANAVDYHIDAKGVIVKDEHAEILKERLGFQIEVTDIDVKAAKKEAEDTIKAEETAKKAKEEAAKKESEVISEVKK